MARRCYRWPENLLRRLMFHPPSTMDTGCIEFTGARMPNGYGRISVGDGQTALAHRAAYELLVGPIPDGLTIDHLCRNRACVNPGHLEPVTGGENTRRGTAGQNLAEMHRAKTHCPSGHPYSGDNLYVRPSDGGRVCRECTREAKRRYRDRLRADAPA